MQRAVAALFFMAPCLALAAPLARAEDPARGRAQAAAAEKRPAAARATTRATGQRTVRDGEAEARLIEIYRQIGQANTREALRKAESLVQDHPNFQLAQLVYGDLLAGLTRPVRTLGDVPDTTAQAAGPLLAELRQESQLRLRALRERPAPGMVPSQFLALSPRTKHAIAVDTSRSRLYL
ncbi:MAG: hypothetical protein ACREXN_15765, partial [Polaromonas sp.]